jgi:hypothetical protein
MVLWPLMRHRGILPGNITVIFNPAAGVPGEPHAKLANQHRGISRPFERRKSTTLLAFWQVRKGVPGTFIDHHCKHSGLFVR